MRMAPTFDGHGIFCEAFAGVKNDRFDPYIPHGVYAKTYGAVLGCSGRSENDRRTLLATIFAAAARSKAEAHVERLFTSRRNDLAVAADLRWTGHHFRDLNSYVGAEISVCGGRIHCRREDASRNVYTCSFRDVDAQIELEARQGFLREGEAELGCFGEMRYDSLYQYGFVESRGDRVATYSSLRHNFITTILGLSVETIRPNKLRLLAKFGWQCAAVRRHSSGTAALWNPHEVFPQLVLYGERHSATAYLGGSYRLGKNWDCCLDLDGNFARNSIAGSAAITFRRHL
jgi:hypothetical protein